MEILQVLQQFNVYLNFILNELNGGSGQLTSADLTYYDEQLVQSLYLVDELNRLIVGPTGIPTPYDFLTTQELSGIIPPIEGQPLIPFHGPENVTKF